MLNFFTPKRKRILSHKVIPDVAGGLCVKMSGRLKENNIILYGVRGKREKEIPTIYHCYTFPISKSYQSLKITN